MARAAVCLSGCGVKDGSEIHEAVLTLLALDQAGAQIVCCAPNVDQPAVVNHLTGATTSEKRNVLVESARIARGAIKDLATVHARDIDAIFFPGGLGAAKNLCTFADDGPTCKVNPEVQRIIGEMLAARKPIAAICIAPAMLARAAASQGVQAEVTIGTDHATAAAITKTGARHKDCLCASFVVDHEHRIVTTPAYMLGKGPAEVFEGIRGLVAEVMRMVKGG
ncbi:MAG: isoprenoid biosynthesis glyoxalase ElbB [Phycisphaerae bacterium]|nr:isoprenoid biosynthesis glyoxalase ElbB [Phycisphaerae bacterium]